MPQVDIVHYNPPETRYETRCGRSTNSVKRWTTDPNDATCNVCVRCIAADRRKKK